MSKGEEIRRRILAGERVVNREPGNSMTPRLTSRQAVLLIPMDRLPEKGDIVFAKVKGRFFTHLVTAIQPDGRVQISNNHGHVNGWTRDVIARVIPSTGICSAHQRSDDPECRICYRLPL